MIKLFKEAEDIDTTLAEIQNLTELENFGDNLGDLIKKEIRNGIRYLFIIKNSKGNIELEIEVVAKSLEEIRKNGTFQVIFNLTNIGDYYYVLTQFDVQLVDGEIRIIPNPDLDPSKISSGKFIEMLSHLEDSITDSTLERKMKYLISQDEYMELVKALKEMKRREMDLIFHNRFIYEIVNESIAVNEINEEGLALRTTFLKMNGDVVTVTLSSYPISFQGKILYLSTKQYMIFLLIKE